MIDIGSTLGVFILGIGTFSLIICILLAYVSNTIYVSFYNEIVSYESYINDFYSFTHSPSSIEFIEEYKYLQKFMCSSKLRYAERLGNINRYSFQRK